MPAFELDFDRNRIAEMQAAGMARDVQIQSVATNLRTYNLERTGVPSPFELQVDNGRVQQAGYEHRDDGDLDASYKKSEETATESRVEKRYALENKGYGEVKKKFFELPIGSTILLMSPPPDESIPGYPGHSNAYFYHILPDSGGNPKKRTIKALTWVNYFDLDEQAEVLNELGAEKAVTSAEASILSQPVYASGSEGSTESFRLLWERMGRLYQSRRRPENFRYVPFEIAEKHLLYGKELWEKQHQALARMTTNLAQRLVNGESDEELADDWDIMLNLADGELLHKDISDQLSEKSFVIDETVMPGRVIFDHYAEYSYAPRVVATPCGLSAGLGSYEGSASVFMTGTYTVEAPVAGDGKGEKTLDCTCPFCKEKVTAIIKDNRIICPRKDACGKSAPYNC